MPAEQRGCTYRTARGWGVRWIEDGRRQHHSGFATKTEARKWWETVVHPRLLGLPTAPADPTWQEHVDAYLEAHAVGREPSTMRVLTERLRYSTKTFGELSPTELERRVPEIAAWTATLPAGSRLRDRAGVPAGAGAAVRWGLMRDEPGQAGRTKPAAEGDHMSGRSPWRRSTRSRSSLARFGPLVVFAAETGLRPEEWLALERRDIDRQAGVVRVERTVVDGRVKMYGKTTRARRSVPLSDRALAALDESPPRLDTPLLFPGVRSGYLNLRNFRRRDWAPACEAAGLKGVRIYDLRHTFASNALAAGITSSVLAHYFGSSERMIDRVYSHLVQGSDAQVRDLLNAYGRAKAEGSGVYLVSDGDGE